MKLTGSDLIYPEIQFLEASFKSCDRLYTCYSEAAVKAMPEWAPHQSSCWNAVGFIMLNLDVEPTHEMRCSL